MNSYIINNGELLCQFLPSSNTKEFFYFEWNNQTYIYENLNDVFVDINETANTSLWINQNQIVSWDEFNNITTQLLSTSHDYLTIRLNIRANTNFNNFAGYFLSCDIQSINNKYINLTSSIWNTDNFINTHIEPILMGENVYTKYIDFHIPSNLELTLNNIYPNETFNLNILNIKAGRIEEYNNITEIIDVNLTTTFNYFSGFSLATFSHYTGEIINDNISAFITPINDYFKLGVEVENSSLLSYINSLPGTNYIVLHDINLYVQYENTYQLIDSLNTIKYDNFNDTINYRPVIINSNNAISYKIKYTVKILNTISNMFQEYESTYINNNPYKYGEKIQKIDVDNPIINKIYNQQINKVIQYNNYDTSTQQIKYETKYFNTNNIKINNDVNLIIKINDIATSLVFNLTKDGQYMDLGNKSYSLVFIKNDQEITIPNKFDNDVDSLKGQLLFEISTVKCKEILSSSNNNFYIVHNDSIIYNGNWSSTSTISTETVFNENILLKNQIEQLTNQNIELQKQINDLNVITIYKDDYVKKKKQEFIPFNKIKTK